MPVLINVVPDKTGAQLLNSAGPAGDPELSHDYQRYFKTYDEMKLDPTIAFARMLAVAPLVTTGWTYEAEQEAPQGAKELVQSICERIRMQVVKQAMEGYIDFGWCGWEVVWGVSDSMANVPKRFKHLVQADSTILIDENTGEYVGIRQEQGANYEQVDLDGTCSMRITIDLSGTQWYGKPLLENSRSAYLAGINVTKSADQYDKKIAGAHWVIHYPIGESPYGSPATETDNFVIAKAVLASLDFSGQIVVPRRIAQTIDELNNQVAKANGEDQWKIELISDSGATSANFIDRNKYLDSLKVRGLGFPERAILEGQFGTKAEAEAHANVALVNFEMRHLILVEQFNIQLTNLILAYNYGEQFKHTVYAKPVPLTNFKLAYWKQIYTQFLSDPGVLVSEYQNLDMTAFRKSLDLPESPYVIQQQQDPLAAYQQQYAQYEQQEQEQDQIAEQYSPTAQENAGQQQPPSTIPMAG